MFYLSDLNAENKTVLLRVDVNAPVKGGVVEDSLRFKEHALTIKELLEKKAKLVVLSHQGRPGGDDFLPLAQHAEILSKYARKKIKYVDDLFGSRAISEVKKLKAGKAILLENTRFYAEESLEGDAAKLAKTRIVSTLAPLADAFVNDAFSAAHRPQATLVGFTALLPSYAGRVMEREYTAIAKAISSPQRPCVYVLGGGKPDDCFDILSYAIETGAADKVLCGGVIGELILLAQGVDLGSKTKWLREQKFDALLPQIKTLLEKHGSKIVAPSDFAYADVDGVRVEVAVEKLAGGDYKVFDVGSSTAKAFAHAISQAKTVYLKGPLGAYEQPAFENGTRLIMKAIESSGAYSLMGGGHTLSALEKFGIAKKKIGHISLAGGAMLAMLGGKPLPCAQALDEAQKRMQSSEMVSAEKTVVEGAV